MKQSRGQNGNLEPEHKKKKKKKKKYKLDYHGLSHIERQASVFWNTVR